jgi:hypothetical protein
LLLWSLLCGFEVASDSEEEDVAALVVVFVEGGRVPKGVPDRDTDLELVVDMCDSFFYQWALMGWQSC